LTRVSPLTHHEMAAYLAGCPPTSFFEGFGRFSARDVSPFAHGLHCHNQRLLLLPFGKPRNRLLIFSPHPGGDGLLDVLDRFLLVFPLRNTAGMCRTFGDNPSDVGFLKQDAKKHDSPFPLIKAAKAWREQKSSSRHCVRTFR
jgi:hypothetical protein